MTKLWPSGSESPSTSSPAAVAEEGRGSRKQVGGRRIQVRKDSDRKVEIKDTEQEGTLCAKKNKRGNELKQRRKK